ncbi:S-layer homology domain-containing protein [Paenibacillus thalictri]|uniref:S-layer homology domain-containing protein n=1 Tax=Paenibacillus thalictri TaxID=2527873 RepID=A0A4Q9DHS4_9BACL|nr:S-layer homology domain-containing protein [Paenibacillus thalictri]TBL71073.1 S-layer homology domain-containing protein [Paenibacillus thalictri]
MIQIQMRKNVLLILLALLCAVSFWSRPAHALSVANVQISTATAAYNPGTTAYNIQVNWSVDPSSGYTIVNQKIYMLPEGTPFDAYNTSSYHPIGTAGVGPTSWTSPTNIANDSATIGLGAPLTAGNYDVYVVVSLIDVGMNYYYVANTPKTVQLTLEPPITVPLVTITTNDRLPANPTYAKVGDTAKVTFMLSKAPSALPTAQIANRNATVTSVGNNVYKAQYTFADMDFVEEGIIGFSLNIQDGGNSLPAVSTTTDTSAVFYDRTNPEGSFTINDGAISTNTTAVALSITRSDVSTPMVGRAYNRLAFAGAATKPFQLASTDQSAWSIQGLLAGATLPPGSGVDKMQFSNDNVNWSGWEPFSETKSWTLEDGDGMKTVYMRLIDKAGNELSQVASASILLQTPPSITPVSISSSNGLTGYAKVGDTVTLTFSLSKPTSSALTATIADQVVTVTSVSYNVYNASYTLTNSDFEGRVRFSIDLGSNPTEVSQDSTTDGTKVIFDKTAPTATVLTINSGAATTNTMAVTLTIEGQDNSRLVRAGKLLASADNSLYTWGPLAYSEPVGSGLGQMQFSNDGVNWSDWEPYATTKAWTLSYGNGTKTVYMKLKDKVGNEMTTPYTATIDLQQPFYSSSSGPSYTPSETITVNVENGVAASGTVVSTATINRTTDANGRKTDAVTFTLDQANKTVDQLKAAGSDSARIVIPDPKDEVSEVNVTIPKASTDSLVKGNVGVEISTANGRVDIPKSSLEGFADDIYFRFVPIKTEDERKVVEDRAKKEQEVRLAVGNDNISIVGRPMTIETNLQSRQVTLVIPLGDTSSLTEQQLQNLGVFIEHSDGTKEFVKGQIVNYDDSGKLGIQFTVTKFSTFTVVKTNGLNKTTHKAYINGYPDGTFGPEKNITRAEMASLLARVSDKAATKSSIAYTDVASSHWAKDAIDQATKMGLMEGYNGGSFKPEQTITRAEMAAILSRISGNSASSGASFNDVNGHWAQSAVAQAKAAGYIDGYADDTFRPEQTLTRAEAVTMINKLLGRGPLSGAASKWSDVSSGSWAFEQIQEASIDHTSEKTATGGEQWVTTP